MDEGKEEAGWEKRKRWIRGKKEMDECKEGGGLGERRGCMRE